MKILPISLCVFLSFFISCNQKKTTNLTTISHTENQNDNFSQSKDTTEIHQVFNLGKDCENVLHFKDITDTEQLYSMRNCFEKESVETLSEFYKHYTYLVAIKYEHMGFPDEIDMENRVKILNNFLKYWEYLFKYPEEFSSKYKNLSQEEYEKELFSYFYGCMGGGMEAEKNEKDVYFISVNFCVGSSTINFVIKEKGEYKIIDEERLYEKAENILHKKFGGNYHCRYGYVEIFNGKKYLIAETLAPDDGNCCPSLYIAIKKKKGSYNQNDFFSSYALSDEIYYIDSGQTEQDISLWNKL